MLVIREDDTTLHTRDSTNVYVSVCVNCVWEYDLRSIADSFWRIGKRMLWSMLLWLCICKIIELVHAKIAHIYAARRRTGMIDELWYCCLINWLQELWASLLKKGGSCHAPENPQHWEVAKPQNCRVLSCVVVCCRVLQCVAVCCSVLQCVAMFCSVSHCFAIYKLRYVKSWLFWSMLQCVAACCRVLQCVAVCCTVLQCVVACCSVLQCVAVCCSVLLCVVVCCRVLSCVAVCCSVLRCVAVCCIVFQFVSACYMRDISISGYRPRDSNPGFHGNLRYNNQVRCGGCIKIWYSLRSVPDSCTAGYHGILGSNPGADIRR